MDGAHEYFAWPENPSAPCGEQTPHGKLCPASRVLNLEWTGEPKRYTASWVIRGEKYNSDPEGSMRWWVPASTFEDHGVAAASQDPAGLITDGVLQFFSLRETVQVGLVPQHYCARLYSSIRPVLSTGIGRINTASFFFLYT